MIEAAWIRARESVASCAPAVGTVLIVMDLDEEPSVIALRQGLLDEARQVRADAKIACVIANRMFENWIVAGTTPLAGKHGLPSELKLRVNRESRGGKHILDELLRSAKRWTGREVPRDHTRQTFRERDGYRRSLRTITLFRFAVWRTSQTHPAPAGRRSATAVRRDGGLALSCGERVGKKGEWSDGL